MDVRDALRSSTKDRMSRAVSGSRGRGLVTLRDCRIAFGENRAERFGVRFEPSRAPGREWRPWLERQGFATRARGARSPHGGLGVLLVARGLAVALLHVEEVAAEGVDLIVERIVAGVDVGLRDDLAPPRRALTSLNGVEALQHFGHRQGLGLALVDTIFPVRVESIVVAKEK
jgi:hypothetical protein